MKFFTKILIFFSIIFEIYGQQKCGQTPIPPNINSRIIGGTIATPHSWPWQAIFCYFSSSRVCDYGCGGAIIGDRWAMTAGHCAYGNVNNPGSFGVRTGAFDLSQNNELGVVVHRIKRIILHPNYNPYPLPRYDIALLELSDRITFNNYTQPICLPSFDNTTIIEPNSAWSTGWGTDDDGQGANRLRQVNLPFINYPKCKRESVPDEIVENVMVCTGTAGKGPCQGDSGGPLMVKNQNGAWFNYGSVSFGTGDNCADANKPSIYSRISTYCNFIQSATKGEVTCQNPITYG
uniref:Peptidase S1 domain-containing protein n=1 Tax=Panagrolaimus sp. PS1159 TaxID=55785 RepID=A0AC35GBX8_9BILA